MIHVPPGGLHDLIYAPPGGAGLLIRSEVMFYAPPGCLHDVWCAPRGLHNVIGTPGGVVLTMYFLSVYTNFALFFSFLFVSSFSFCFC